jgi:hypothetical protein
MIASDDFDRLSKNLTAYVLEGHSRGLNRGPAAEIPVGARLVVEDSNANATTEALCMCRSIEE